MPSASGLVHENRSALVVIGPDGTAGHRFDLREGQTDLGRTEGDILLQHDAYVCPRHARFLLENDRWWVRDLGSVNGIYLKIRSPNPLVHGDLVLVGLEVLRFELVTDVHQSTGTGLTPGGPSAGRVVHGLEPAIERGTRVFGSPGSPRYARLCQRTVEGITRNVHYVCTDRTIIGREEGDLVFGQDPFMSRRHASIDREDGGSHFVLRDLGSSNGTFLAVRGRTELRSGDHLRIGQHLFKIDIAGTGLR